MAVFLGGLVGALLACGILSRILLALLKNMGDTVDRILIANGVSLVLCFVLSGFGAANGGAFVPTAGLVYVLPQGLMVAIDLFARKGRLVQKTDSPPETPRGRLEL
jgi:hypothetical protein